MRGLWKKWVALAVFVAVLGTTFVLLGNWQLDRLDQRRATNARIMAAESAPIRPYQEVFGQPISEEDQWQRVEVSGTYEPVQVVVRYRNYDSQPGIEILTPLRTDQGDLLLVDRGFLPDGQRELTAAEAPAPPSGPVTLIGHVRRNENGPTRATVPDDHGRLRLISSPHIAEYVGEPLLDGYLSVIESDPPQSGEFVPVPTPELSDGPHFWYAMQWFLFMLIAVAGLIVFIRSDIMGKGRTAKEDDDDSDEEDLPTSPSPAAQR